MAERERLEVGNNAIEADSESPMVIVKEVFSAMMKAIDQHDL